MSNVSAGMVNMIEDLWGSTCRKDVQPTDNFLRTSTNVSAWTKNLHV